MELEKKHHPFKKSKNWHNLTFDVVKADDDFAIKFIDIQLNNRFEKFASQ